MRRGRGRRELAKVVWPHDGTVKKTYLKFWQVGWESGGFFYSMGGLTWGKRGGTSAN